MKKFQKLTINNKMMLSYAIFTLFVFCPLTWAVPVIQPFPGASPIQSSDPMSKPLEEMKLKKSEKIGADADINIYKLPNNTSFEEVVKFYVTTLVGWKEESKTKTKTGGNASWSSVSSGKLSISFINNYIKRGDGPYLMVSEYKY